MGFGAPMEGHDYDSMRDKILDESKRVFKPEISQPAGRNHRLPLTRQTELLRIVELEVPKY